MGDVQYHIRCKPGDVGEVVLLPGDPGRVEPIAKLLDRPRLIARNREYTTYTGAWLVVSSFSRWNKSSKSTLSPWDRVASTD